MTTLGRAIDVAVIGAGVLGLATTDALVRRGVDVLCFDGRPPGQAQSGGLTRTFRHRHDNDLVVQLAVEAREGFRQWERRSGRRMVGQEGAVYAGMTDSDVKGLVAHGVPHSFVPAERHREFFGPLAPVDGPLLIDPGAGAIRARRVIDALSGWVRDRIVPAEVHAVTIPVAGRGVEFHTADAIHRARHVVIVAGTATPRIAAGVEFDVPLQVALHARPHYEVRDEHRGGPLPCWVDRSGRYGETVYGSPIGSTGRYVLGLIGDDVDIPLTPAGALPPGRSMDEHVRRVGDYVRRALPGLDPRPVGVRVCTMTKLPAGSDAFHAWHTPGVTALTGHNLFKLAPVLGELLAETALTDRLAADLARAGAGALDAPAGVR
ncbi:FAD-dependent oxidoreductase [Solwaraspora sp. WMMD791]|uniref:NAD(P)/FAD-dependent oxidoreductase n=1 Tax=Solwaraspora sp. WMMD791 TaxID=3016086 RepID=UPI00249A8E85|nr:FAD-dependent oxidoreductase [Solwaraspora sp. WMMD791]WFE30112.1 FAD-dependent oxidoreductase [Solwaraspora sp. WMMD791]